MVEAPNFEEMNSKYQQFKEWQQQPHQVAPLKDEHHECATCGTHYEGNYCPRCGQSARIARYSFKNAFLLFIDVWGLGNRGMFRSIRDLILRPGYMIRDYLTGMQMAYFPPFKMFFLLIALSLLIDSGLNIRGVNRIEEQEHTTTIISNQIAGKEVQSAAKDKQLNPNAVQQQAKAETVQKDAEKDNDEKFERATENVSKWIKKHRESVDLIGLLLFSLPLYLLFRRSPALPDIRISECFVAMVYITNMIIIYGLIPSLFCFSLKAEAIYDVLSVLLVIIPIKQLSGYSYWSTVWRLVAAAIPFAIMCFLLLITVIVTSVLIE